MGPTVVDHGRRLLPRVEVCSARHDDRGRFAGNRPMSVNTMHGTSLWRSKGYHVSVGVLFDVCTTQRADPAGNRCVSAKPDRAREEGGDEDPEDSRVARRRPDVQRTRRKGLNPSTKPTGDGSGTHPSTLPSPPTPLALSAREDVCLAPTLLSGRLDCPAPAPRDQRGDPSEDTTSPLIGLAKRSSSSEWAAVHVFSLRVLTAA
jgi:hypothetical protein